MGVHVESQSFFSLTNPLLHLCYGLAISVIFVALMYLRGHYRAHVREGPLHWNPRLQSPVLPGQCFGRADLVQQCPVHIFESKTATAEEEGTDEDQEHTCAICLAELEAGDEVRT